MGARSDCLNDMLQLFAHHNAANAAAHNAAAATTAAAASAAAASASAAGRGGGRGAVADARVRLALEPSLEAVKVEMGKLLKSNTFVAGRASSWASNQPATLMEFLASDLPISIPMQVVLLLAAIALAARTGLACFRALLLRFQRPSDKKGSGHVSALAGVCDKRST
mmetsp:Transcript_29329/g.49452  ORF Transcript_29329/g.49452 Transcript_29329/m.49452 type:complete len:167 (+) Transcript_29329:127-627(+)